MRIQTLVLGLALLLSSTSEAKKNLQLPIADGTYVASSELCSLTDEELSQLGDRTYSTIMQISGNKIAFGEARCEAVTAKLSGKILKLRLLCEVEGQPEASDVVWRILSKTRFREGDKTFSICNDN